MADAAADAGGAVATTSQGTSGGTGSGGGGGKREEESSVTPTVPPEKEFLTALASGNAKLVEHTLGVIACVLCSPLYTLEDLAAANAPTEKLFTVCQSPGGVRCVRWKLVFTLCRGGLRVGACCSVLVAQA